MIVVSKKISFGELAHSKWVNLTKISKVPQKKSLCERCFEVHRVVEKTGAA